MANRRASDEYKVLSAENSGEVLTAFNRIPYSLINAESDDENTHDVLTELAEIVKYYKEYYDGVDFTSEGTNGDYIPAKLNYRMTYSLINKEARFLFAEAPDIEIQPSGIVGTPSEEYILIPRLIRCIAKYFLTNGIGRKKNRIILFRKTLSHFCLA